MTFTSSIQLWTPGDSLIAPEVIYHSQDHYKLKRLYQHSVKRKANTQHCRFYKVLPNGTKYIEFIKAHILHNNKHSINWIKSQDSIHPHWRTQLGLINDLCRAFNEFNHANCTNIIERLDTDTLPSETGLAINIISDLCHDIFYLLSDKTPYQFTQLDNNHKAWWLHQTSIKSRIAHTHSKINRLYAKQPPEPFDSLTNWLATLEKEVDKFLANERMDWPRHDAIRHASAYCWALCERQFSSGNASLALLMAHRSIDLLLLSVCASKNLINFSRNKAGLYKSNNEKITVTDSLSALENYISANSARDNLFTEINSWRNQLMYTHYLTGIAENEALQILSSAGKHLEKIGGKDWQKTRDFFLKPFEIKPLEILNINNNISATYEEVAL